MASQIVGSDLPDPLKATRMPILDQTLGLLIAYSGAVVLASVWGGMLPDRLRMTHTRMQLLISFIGGLMLGVAVFHMVPHALTSTGGPISGDDVDTVSLGVMLGLVATFFLLRFFHFHQHGPADFGIQAADDRDLGGDADEVRSADGQSKPAVELSASSAKSAVEHTHLCSDHNHPSQSHDHSGRNTTRWVGVLVGLAFHTLLDGVALASGVITDVAHHHGTNWAGHGIFLAVFLHKPLDAVSITSLMYASTTPNQRLAINVGFALMCPLGAFAFFLGAMAMGTAWAASLAAWGLAFSAGVFLCISLSDLLPEMEFHSHSRIRLTVALLLGILAAWLLGILEGEHSHGGDEPRPVQEHRQEDVALEMPLSEVTSVWAS
ncbi:MAG: ZIP family metal transporter [Pirellulaceae bacterium]